MAGDDGRMVRELAKELRISSLGETLQLRDGVNRSLQCLWKLSGQPVSPSAARELWLDRLRSGKKKARQTSAGVREAHNQGRREHEEVVQRDLPRCVNQTVSLCQNTTSLGPPAKTLRASTGRASGGGGIWELLTATVGSWNPDDEASLAR